MALLWLEGFEGFFGVNTAQNNADAIRKYPGSTMDNSGRPVGRFGGKAFQGGSTQRLFTRVYPSPQDTYICGMAIRFGKWPTTTLGLPIIVFHDGTGTRQVGVWMGKEGEITVKRNLTTIGTVASTIRLHLWRWYYLEFKATINNTTGSFECSPAMPQ